MGSGELVEVADHVLQDLDEFDIQLRVLLVDLRAQARDDFVDASAAIAFKLHGGNRRCWLR